ncbi:hypothetical protein B0H17DRAFT_40850 [Mycena rosella]|uniref:Uncharacterized protein n=1 Tax=Mycena rosella TaxID=1033263 RepID=A0AAD7M6Y6_MYCRO|nr:hypothetical protein B0H17DRAFT_40850 [Mycena rosella]
MLWAYVKVIITPPGERLRLLPQNPRSQWTTETRFRHQPADTPASASFADIEAGRIGGPAYEELRPATPPAAHVPGTALPLPLANGHAPFENGHAPLANGQLTNAPPLPRRKSSARSRRDDGEAAPVPPRGRFPPTTAALLPLHRWYSRCAIVKPYRAHHCRVCGTVRPLCLLFPSLDLVLTP